MRACRLQNVLCLLSLLGASGVHASQDSECNLQAWVRAPDLAPDTIIQGDARLKLAAGCTTVGSASLGLRFKERAFVKASSDDSAPERKFGRRPFFDLEQGSPTSPWDLPAHHTVNCSADIAIKEIVKNKALWFVREEERIVFESTQAIDMEEVDAGAVRDVVHEFAILVPSTNFPPAFDYPRSIIELRDGEFVNVETMYEYFVRVAFMNGTTVEIPAGFTAFQPVYDPPSEPLVRSKTIHLETKNSLKESLIDNDPVANYTAEIETIHGFVFSQGVELQGIKVTITRTGRARTFTGHLSLSLCIDTRVLPKWASEYTSDPTLQSIHKSHQNLRATSADFKHATRRTPYTPHCSPLGRTSIPKKITMYNATADDMSAGAIVTTSSFPDMFLVDPDPRHATDFGAYYHTVTSGLYLTLDVPRAQDEPPNEADVLERRAMRRKTPEVNADEEAWVPWQAVPEVAGWRGARVVMESPGGNGSECVQRSPVHYLTADARAPIFVDGRAASVEALRAETLAARDALAPLLDPVVSSPPEGEERVHRYYRVSEGDRPLIYVGETWVKKVAHRDEHKVVETRPDRMPNALAHLAAAMKHMYDEL